eukprot:103536_1
MAFQTLVDPSLAASVDELVERTTQSEQEVLRLQNEIEHLEAGDAKTFVMQKILEIRQTIQLLNNRKIELNENNTSLKQQITGFKQLISSMKNELNDPDSDEDESSGNEMDADTAYQHMRNLSTHIEDHEQYRGNRDAPSNEDNKDDNDDASHGYANQKLSGKCQCEMCREGIATTHNDESHDQSLFGKFALDVDPKFKLELVGGSTKCGRVMSNYFAYLEVTKQAQIFRNKNCLEVGSGTGIVGCTVAYLGANKVMMTDQPGVIDILSENAKQLNEYNQLYDEKIKIGELLWGNEDARKYVNDNEGNGYDILIGSDLIYAHEFIEPLVTTFEVLSENVNKKTKKHAIVYMSVIRRFKWEENFFNLMKNKFVQYKELEVGDICIYKYIRKEDVGQ